MLTQTILRRDWRSLLNAARPKTLTAAVAPVSVASFLAMNQGFDVDWILSVYALLSSFCIQIGTNLTNDAFDFKKGADTEKRIGPERITQKGILTFNQVLFAAALFFGLSVLFAVPLIVKGGVIVAGTLAVSILAGYMYTAGPFPLGYKGLGEVFVLLFFGIIATSVFYYILTAGFSLLSCLAGIQIGLHCTVMIAINNIRDRIGDAKVGKNTLAVRFGENFAKNEIAFLLYAPFFMGVFWLLIGQPVAAILPCVILFPTYRFEKTIRNTPIGPIYNTFLAKGAFLHFSFALLLSLALLIN